MLWDEIWTAGIALASSLVSGIGTFIFTKSKYKAEVEGSKIQNFDAAITAYKKMYEDMIADLEDRNRKLKEEVDSLKSELDQNRQQIMTLTNFVLASAIQRADGNLNLESVEKLKDIINGETNKERRR